MFGRCCAVAAVLVVCLTAVAVNAASGYDIELSTRAQLYSRATYCSGNTLQKWQCGASCTAAPIANFNLSAVLTIGEARAMTGVDVEHRQLLVAFRGSGNAANWIADFTFDPVSCSYGNGCKVHRGFLETYTLLRQRVLEEVYLLTKAYPAFTWLITGHSLGGALATLAAADLTCYLPYIATMESSQSWMIAKLVAMAYAQGGNMNGAVCGSSAAAVYTFEAPRVGNPAFVQWFEAHVTGPHFRVVQSKDPVPHVPLRAMGYLHTMNEVWYSDKNQPNRYTECAGSAQKESHACSNGVLPLDMKDHVFVRDVCMLGNCEEGPGPLSLSWKSIIILVVEFVKGGLGM